MLNCLASVAAAAVTAAAAAPQCAATATHQYCVLYLA